MRLKHYDFDEYPDHNNVKNEFPFGIKKIV